MNTPQTATTADQSANPTQRVIPLETPLIRGDTKVTSITLNKPSAGALRGLSLAAISQLDVIALQTLVPRISEPVLTPQEMTRLDPVDLMAVGSAVATFFMSKAEKAAYQIE